MHPLQQHIIVDKKHHLVVVSPHLTYHFISKFVARSPENLLDPYGVYFAEHNSLYIPAKTHHQIQTNPIIPTRYKNQQNFH